MAENRPADRLAVVSPIADDRSQRAVDLVEQEADERCITLIGGCQGRRQDLAGVGIDREMQLPPGPARLAALLFQVPFAGHEDLQASAADHDLDQTVKSTIPYESIEL